MSRIPAWLERLLDAQGKLNRDGISRKARAGFCRSCGQVVMRGLDADVAGLPVACDPTPLDRLGEALALLGHRETFELRWTGRTYELDHRDASKIAARPAGTARHVDVLAAHSCDSAPLPTDPRGPVAVPIHAAGLTDECPY